MEKISVHMDLDKSKLEKKFEFAKYDDMEDLNHCDRHSFYGKAYKTVTKRYEALYSYDTLICVYDKLKNILHVSKYYWNYSATTRRHQIGFLDDVFGDPISGDIYQRLSLEGKYR
ncbi:hypothetical protein [Lactobacillus hominis]|uniref:DUF8033 domain-containing protein n=1 Tax=Lactobacillus hominis DSM 23910 = CRBIP 24.179 TaxID=1423758 RepID=I7IVK8_9LACO|nr:hypothetical protein [Lactobacillus hominis]KRM85838.1 hypothetical protein FC41_GL000024 [Lactobacillus hominis DSM 23910 = CRBIP 24.179]MCT3348926.1 hypothetical protein [Lactobacillus hominis]CCI81618.1 Protein of unknown function [Lactobacillus hominis DSM 23910 = CRBIP 24.179]